MGVPVYGSAWITTKTIHLLQEDQSFEGVESRDTGGFNLNGHRLTIGAGGINIYTNHGAASPDKIYGQGCLTSSDYHLIFNFKNTQSLHTGYVISSTIINNSLPNRFHKVGVAISGGVPGRESHIDLTGNESNTFTGHVNISGHAGALLYKSNGATAIQGDITVSDNGYLGLGASHQIADSSTVRLNGNRGTAELLFHPIHNSEISEKFHKLIVNEKGLINFYFHWQVPGAPHGTRYLYLDDLEVTTGGELLIDEWSLGRDYLLVKKGSIHLQDSLKRIRFSGKPAGWHGGIKEYNKDYWQLVPDLPEPTTYGVFLGAASLMLWFCRRRPPPAARQRTRRQIKGSKTP